jgi:hypothetical protein
MSKFKLVFKVIDVEANADVFPSQETIINFSEETLAKADEEDKDLIRKAVEIMGGEHFAAYASLGRGKVVKEICQAAGILISRYLDRQLAPKLGCKHIALLDKSQEQANV